MLVRCDCGWEGQFSDELRGQTGACRFCGDAISLMPAVPQFSPDSVEMIEHEVSGPVALSAASHLRLREGGNPQYSTRFKVGSFLAMVLSLVALGTVTYRVATSERPTGPAQAGESGLVPVGAICRIFPDGLFRIATSDAAWYALGDAEAAGDTIGIGKMVMRGEVVLLDSGVRLRKLKTGIDAGRYRVESGDFIGATAIVPNAIIAPIRAK